MSNSVANKIRARKDPNDVIYTPLKVAKLMIEMCEIKENETILDCSRGGGIFYDNYPENCNKDYCEITENKDFFKYDKKVDIICGNPPYSLWTKWIEKTLKICDRFCYIFGQMNLTGVRLNMIKKAGFRIKKFHICEIKWWFGRSFIVLFERSTEPSIISFSEERFICECGDKKCKRGMTQSISGVKKKWGMNECSVVKKVNKG
tara:strand:+ start:234 stop:845 length:612 start_codon:yes stop_codon:yes gene_type:complete